MRIAIFGSSGFIGKAVVRYALKGHELFLFSRPEADVRDPASYATRLTEIKPDVVINLTALIGTMLSSPPVLEMFETNTMGCLDLASVARQAGAKSYVSISSTVVHGESKKGERLGRYAPFAPKHPYSAAKAAAEYALEQFSKEQPGMAVVSLRPPMVIGEGSKVLLPPVEFVQEAMAGRDIQIFGDGLHEREFVSAKDIALGIWKAVEWSALTAKGFHPFFLTGNPLSIKDLAEKVAKRLGGRIFYAPSSKQAFSLVTDPSDTERVIGWKASDDIEGILDEVEAFVRKGK